MSKIVTADCHGRTDIGQKRETNQDRFVVAELKRQMTILEGNIGDTARHFAADVPGKLLIVADGVGGHAGGDIASTIAVQTVCDYVLNSMHRFLKLADERDEEFRDELAAALDRCQRRLNFQKHTRPELADMGATLTVAYIVWPRMYIVHAGDSRAYLFRDGELRQLTTDHTVAQQFVEAGTLQRENLSASPWRHVIWNCLGSDRDEIAPEVIRVDLRSCDLVLLCTDGLTDQLRDDDLSKIVARPESAETLTMQLVESANARGGHDDVTAVVARFQQQTATTPAVSFEESDIISTKDTAIEANLTDRR